MADKQQAQHANIAQALAAAQAEMGKALKSANNPHFKSKYADLGAVVDACFPALNAHGIAVIQTMTESEFGRAVVTKFLHGSGDVLECAVPLLLGKQDMQGLGSAMTYARRYGLMALAGIAPEDDDGNAAAGTGPATVSPQQYITLRDLIEATGTDEARFLSAYNATAAGLQQFPAQHFAKAKTQLERKRDAQKNEAA